MERANCKGLDPELFFPTREASPQQVEAAKAVCAGCTVTEQCLHLALLNNEKDGIWGGLSGRQRRLAKPSVGGKPVRCINCDKEFLGHSQSKLCSPECRDERLRASRRKYLSSRRAS